MWERCVIQSLMLVSRSKPADIPSQHDIEYSDYRIYQYHVRNKQHDSMREIKHIIWSTINTLTKKLKYCFRTIPLYSSLCATTRILTLKKHASIIIKG